MHLLWLCSQVTLYYTMAHSDKELIQFLRKGRDVAASLGKVYDCTKMDAIVKKGHADPAKMDLCQTVKQGQTVIQNLDNESARNHLDRLLKQSIEIFGRPNQNGPKVSLFLNIQNLRQLMYIKLRKSCKVGGTMDIIYAFKSCY